MGLSEPKLYSQVGLHGIKYHLNRDWKEGADVMKTDWNGREESGQC